MSYKKIAAAIMVALIAASLLAIESTTASATGEAKAPLRIQLGYYTGLGYWKPWNSTFLNLHGENSRFTIAFYNLTYRMPPGLLIEVHPHVVPDAKGNITLTLKHKNWTLWRHPQHKDSVYTVRIWWNITTSDVPKRELSFLVFNASAYIMDMGIYGRQLIVKDPFMYWVANWTRYKLAVCNITVVAMDSMDPPGPLELGGARIKVINGTNWDKKRFAAVIPPSVLYDITTPEHTARVTFLLPNTTNVLYKPCVRKEWNYTVGLRVYWNHILVHNRTLTQDSFDRAWYPKHSYYPLAWRAGLWSPFNFTEFSDVVALYKRPVWLNCSVYGYEMYLTAHTYVHLGLPTTAFYEIEASMSVTNATLGSVVIARPKLTNADGWVALRYAAPCVDDEDGNRFWGIGRARANLTVYYRSHVLGVHYLIFNRTLTYGDWAYGDTVAYGNMTKFRARHTTFRCYANYSYIQLFDKTDPIHPVPLAEGTKVTVTFPGGIPYTFITNGTGFVDMSAFKFLLPLRDGFTKLDKYKIKAEYLGVDVLSVLFDPNAFKTIKDTGRVYKSFLCDIFYFQVQFTDAKGRSLANMSTMKLIHPTGVEVTLPVYPGGLWVGRLPKGEAYKVAVRYKSADWLAPLEVDIFDVATNIYTPIPFKLPIYDVYIKVTDWEGAYWVEHVNASFKWPYPYIWTQWGNMSTPPHPVSRRIEPPRYVMLYQIPKGTHTLGVFATKALKALDAFITYPIGKATVAVVDKDVYEPKVRTWIYNPAIYIRALGGEDLPAYTLAANTTRLVTVFNVSTAMVRTDNVTEGLPYIKLLSNITHNRVFIGGVKYNFTLYAGGVTVYGPTLTLPKPPGDVSVTARIAKVTFITKDHYGKFTIPNLNVTVIWSGLNYTYPGVHTMLDEYRSVNTTIVANWNFIRDVDQRPYSPGIGRSIILFKELKKVTGPDGEVVIYVPVWDYRKFADHTPIEFNATTLPGKTLSVPAHVEPVSVIWRATKIPVHKSPYFLNVTTTVSKELKTYAADFKALVTDTGGGPLARYMADVWIEEPLDKVREASLIEKTALTGTDGILTLASKAAGPIYWCNYSYTLWIYANPKVDAVDQDGKPIALKYYALKPFIAAKGWKPALTFSVSFLGLRTLDLVDDYLTFLPGTLATVKATGGVAAGEDVAYGFSDDKGKVFIPLPNKTWFYYSYYNATDKTYRLEKNTDINLRVYWTKAGKVFLSVLIGAADKLTPEGHITMKCAVFYAKFRFVSDTLRVLELGALKIPPGPDKGIPLTVTYYIAGTPRPDAFEFMGLAFENGTFALSKVPIGDYKIEAWWPNARTIKIYDVLRPIDRSVPLENLKTLVYDIMLVFKTPRGTACDNATAKVIWPQGVVTKEVTDLAGKVLLINVPLGKLTVNKPLMWRGFDSLTNSVTKDVAATTTYDIIADNIITLTVRAIGARGQSLPYAGVTIVDPVTKVPIVKLVSDEAGVAWTELPRIRVTIAAEYRGKTAEKTVTLPAPPAVEHAETMTLDVFIELFGYAMSGSEFALAILLTVVLIFIIAFLIHEYAVWRRKRIAIALVKA